MSEKKKTAAPKSAEEKEQKNRIPENVSGAEKLNELIERGKKNGKLTTNEMMELDGVELDSATLDRFYDILENLGIALVTEYELPETDDENATEEIDNLKGEMEELKAEGIISGGMIPKVECCTNAIRAGVRKVFIIDGRVPHALLIETLTDEGAGTMFKKEIEGNYVPRS